MRDRAVYERSRCRTRCNRRSRDAAPAGSRAGRQLPVSAATHWSKASLLLSGLSMRPWRVHWRIASARSRIGDRIVVGRSVGRIVGSSVGRIVGSAVVGFAVGSLVGSGVALVVGPDVGVGWLVGVGVGWPVGVGVGLWVGVGVGLDVGPLVGSGSAVGWPPPPPPPPPPPVGFPLGGRVPLGSRWARRRSRRRRTPGRRRAPGRRTPGCGCSGTPTPAGRRRWPGRRCRSRGTPRWQRRVVDVLGVALPVAVGVDADDRPRGRDELHRPDRAVELGVAVERARVGVGDGGGAVRAVEREAVDRRLGQALVVRAGCRRRGRGRTRHVRWRRRAATAGGTWCRRR